MSKAGDILNSVGETQIDEVQIGAEKGTVLINLLAEAENAGVEYYGRLKQAAELMKPTNSKFAAYCTRLSEDMLKKLKLLEKLQATAHNYPLLYET